MLKKLKLKIIDRYILKKYFLTFFTIVLLFIPVGIMVDLAEKIDRLKETEAPLNEIIEYYISFMWYFGYLLFPIFLLLSIIWFTSKMANNTEVIAILSSGISFYRYLRPFIIGALCICVFSFLAGMYIVPDANKKFQEFDDQYLSRKKKISNTYEVYKQISENEFIYVSYYEPARKLARDFTLEYFDGTALKCKIMANTIRWVPQDSVFRLSNYKIRKIIDDNSDEIYIQGKQLDTVFNFKIENLAPVTYLAETLKLKALNELIAKEKKSGSKLINSHLLVRHKRYTIPLSAFVLTFISVAVASFKRRGGMGINLAFGITFGFVFIFFDKIFGVMVIKSNFSPFLGSWSPVFIFILLTVVMLNYAKR